MIHPFRRLTRMPGAGLVLALSLLAGCSSLRQNEQTDKEGDKQPLIAGPGKYHLRESQYVFYSDFPLKPSLPLFKELGELREQICKDLQLPPSDTVIQVFLFEDEERYVKYMQSRYRDLPLRQAFFIKQPKTGGGTDDLLVFTWWSPQIRKDLRHELTHGVLHSVLKDVPLWLDEGLAEVYELPPENGGINAGHLDAIRKNGFQPDLAKLEQLSEVKQMLRPEYREAWAWTHFMLCGAPVTRNVLLAYLQDLRQPNPQPLLPKLKEAHSKPAKALVEHLSALERPALGKQ